MFPYHDPQTQLDLYHLRAAELHRRAEAYRIGRSAPTAGRHRRFGRAARRAQAVRAPAMS
jgi:hypothetical protein